MNIKQLQALIDGADSPEEMNRIAQSYLEGAVLRDPVAAEAWLLRSIELGDSPEAVKAMEALTRLLGKAQTLPPSEFPLLREQLSTAQEQEKPFLEALLSLKNH